MFPLHQDHMSRKQWNKLYPRTTSKHQGSKKQYNFERETVRRKMAKQSRRINRGR